MTAEDAPQSGRELPPYHLPVLSDRIAALLVTDRDGLYIDATVGGGGHAERLCSMLGAQGQLLCLDADHEAIAAASRRLAACGKAICVQANFREVRQAWQSRSLRQPAGILLDLGVSSHQLDEGARGFSFRSDAPLDMRFDQRQPLSALDVVNGYDERRLADILFQYGEEHASRAIARRIVAARPLRTTGELVAVVERVAGGRFLTKSLARVFQAIRIEVNQELAALQTVLNDGVGMLAAGGRIAVIAYHSLEDRMVKETFRQMSASSIPSGTRLLPPTPVTPAVQLLTRRPLLPTEEECAVNVRARSAKLRVAEKI